MEIDILWTREELIRFLKVRIRVAYLLLVSNDVARHRYALYSVY